MMAHARQVPGSTRSRRTPLSRSATRPRRFASPSKNPYKIRPKPDHFRECECCNASLSTTYNFNPLKCTDFLAAFCPDAPRQTFSLSHFLTGNVLLWGQPFASLAAVCKKPTFVSIPNPTRVSATTYELRPAAYTVQN